MRFGVFIAVVFLPFFGLCQSMVDRTKLPLSSISKTDYYLNLYSQADLSETLSFGDVSCLIVTLEEKRNSFRRDHDFLRYIFYKTHKKLLKRYVEYCPFSALLKDGTYNCLTGTALYALLLDHFNIDYSIIETNYHIFLVARTDKGDILFEATDPMKGFVDSKAEILKRTSAYKENKMTRSGSNKVYHPFNFSLYNAVNLDELLGLLYYNLSIEAYNKKAYTSSVNFLDLSVKLYHSPRTEEFSKILLLTIAENNSNDVEKNACLRRIQTLRKKMPVLASITTTPH